MIQTHYSYTVTAGQLLPLSWNRRRVKSQFNLRLLCPCIKSKGIIGTEWTHRHMIVLAECECINLALLSLQELLSPTVQMTELPVLRHYNCEETKSDCVLLWFEHKRGNKKSKKRSVITCSGKVTSYQVRDYNVIRLIVALAANIFFTNVWRERKIKAITSCFSHCRAGDSLNHVILRCAQLAGRRWSSP